MAEGRPKKIALVGATGYQYESIEARVESGEGFGGPETQTMVALSRKVYFVVEGEGMTMRMIQENKELADFGVIKSCRRFLYPGRASDALHDHHRDVSARFLLIAVVVRPDRCHHLP